MDKIDSQKNRDRNRRGDRPSRFSDSNTRERDRSRDNMGRESYRVIVSNIPYEYKWTDVKDLFKKEVGGCTFVEIFSDDNNKSKGCGVVEFSSPEYVKKALEVMHRYTIAGRKLVVKEDLGMDNFGNDRARHERDERNDDYGQNQFESERYNTYGLNPQFLDSLGIRGPIINRVFVANLFYKVDAKKLKEVFKLAGKVRNVDLSLDKEGNSRGFAVIEFDHPVEAVQAISMLDKQVLYERKMAVRMDKANNHTEIKLPEGLVAVGPGLGPNGEPLRNVAQNISQINQPTASQNNSSVAQVGTGASTLQASGLLGAVPALGGLGLQALGQLGLGQLQSQLLQQGLGGGGDLSNLGDLGGAGTNSNLNSNLLSGLNSAAFGRQSNNFTHNNAMSPGLHGDGSAGNNVDKVSDMVLIRNLPPSMTWQLIREKFSEVGNIKYAEKIDNETAVVRFTSEWTAERAIKMFDQTRIDGRTISLRMF